MNNIRKLVSAVLAKTDSLLKSEPARAIGYGSAVVIYLIARVLAERGYVRFANLSFEDSVVAAIAAIAVVGGIVESIRRFVYSPQTYMEDIADEWLTAVQQGHEEAHFEDAMKAAFEQAMAEAQAAQAPQTKTAVVGTAKAAGTSDKAN